MLARIGLGGLALVVTAAVLFLGFEPKSDTFLAPRRLSSPGSLVSDGCCQFADHFQGVNWYDANVRSDFLKNVLSVERRFFAAPGAAFDADSGMTYDGTSLDLTTGDVQPEGLRLFSAPSKESLHISLLALALQKPKDVLPEHSQLLSLLYSQDEALDILEKKEASKVQLRELVKKLIPESIGKEREKQCQGIFPLKDCLIRKVKILKKPKFDITKLMELHGEGGDDTGVEMMRPEADEAMNTLTADVAAAGDDE